MRSTSTTSSGAAEAPSPDPSRLDGIALAHALLQLVPEIGVVVVDAELICHLNGGAALELAGGVEACVEALRQPLLEVLSEGIERRSVLRSASGASIDVRIAPCPSSGGAMALFRERVEERAARREEEADRRERLYQTVARNLPDSAVLLFDTELRYLLAEGPALEATGYPATEIVGRTLPEVLRAEAAERTAPVYRAVLEGRSVDVTQTLDDGRTFSIRAVPVREGGEVVAGIVVARDVSREHRLEAQLRQSQKMEAVGTLASGVAHDYNNLLMGILGCADISLRYIAAESRARPFLEQIQRAAKRGASLTRQLLLFSRRKEARPTLVDLGAVVLESEKMLRSLLGESISLELILDNAGWWVRCDPGHMQQVLMNLVVNARDAMPEGGRLVVATGRIELPHGGRSALEEEAPGHYITLAVRDTGVGMDEETMERVFEPFFTTKEVGRGTGLGLSTVYGIVKQAGGYIDVESAQGRGASFTVYLPRALPSVAEGSAKRAPRCARRGGETVLIVDDEPLVRLTLRAFLEPLGYEVLEAGGRDEASLIAETLGGPLHLLIADVMLPGASGNDVEADLRAHHPALRVIYISAHPEELLREGGHLPKDALLLEKPFDEAILVAEVERALGGR